MAPVGTDSKERGGKGPGRKKFSFRLGGSRGEKRGGLEEEKKARLGNSERRGGEKGGEGDKETGLEGGSQKQHTY